MERLPTLEGSRLRLRWLTEADAPQVLALFGDPEITRWMGIERRRDEAHAAELIASIAAHANADDLYQWGVALRETDEVIGTVTLASIHPRNRRAELGFAIATAHQRRGYAREAVSTALDHAFGEMDLHRLEADVDPDNAASLQLLQRLGFRREGYMPQRWWVDGRWTDTVFFGLLADDWRGGAGVDPLAPSSGSDAAHPANKR